MSFEFNKSLLIDNIEYLLKERKKRVGELEAEIGVSAGYISRISKDGGSKPGVDFIGKVAEALNVSIDSLLTVSLTQITPTEEYLFSFFDKLKSDTVADKLDWEKESSFYLNNLETDINGRVNHPLFDLESFTEKNENGYPEDVSRVVFTSYAFGYHTYISENCFHLELKDKSVVYLMNVGYTEGDPTDPNNHVIEVWMEVPRTGVYFVCNTKSSSVLAQPVEDLYQTISDFSRHPKLKLGVRLAIDAYMRGDNKENENDDDDLPF